MRVAFMTLGCKVNQYETSCIENSFITEGFEVVPFSEKADIYVINTCCVTAESDKKSRHYIRRARRINEAGVIAVCGCFAEKDKGKSALESGADIVVGSTGKSELINRVLDFFKSRDKFLFDFSVNNEEKIEKMTSHGIGEKTRAGIKVEDGCNNFCTYCIIPYVRGRIRSKPLNEVLEEVKGLIKQGFSEIVITGIHLSSYGKDLENITLTELIEEISKIDGVKRIRLGSLEPTYITDETVKRLSKISSLCPHFHLSLQSGSDITLKDMKRKYTSVEYENSVRLIRQHFDNTAITTDIMTGFPGETDEDFEKSLNFFKKIDFSQAHIFTYSIREGTAAEKFDNQVPEHIKIQRSKILSKAADESRERFLSRQIGKTEEVLFEMQSSEGIYTGYTKNYTPILTKSQLSLTGTIQRFVISEVKNGICYGEIISE